MSPLPPFPAPPVAGVEGPGEPPVPSPMPVLPPVAALMPPAVELDPPDPGFIPSDCADTSGCGFKKQEDARSPPMPSQRPRRIPEPRGCKSAAS
jgi:hypothetical protein